MQNVINKDKVSGSKKITSSLKKFSDYYEKELLFWWFVNILFGEASIDFSNEIYCLQY